MQIDTNFAVLIWIWAIVLLLSLLKTEKLVKLTYGSYWLLAFSLALGTLILHWVADLQSFSSETFLGMSYWKIAEWLSNWLPTILLVLYVLLLWWFISYSHLSISLSSDAFERKVQTLIWCILCLGSIVSSIYFILAYFQWAVYETLFLNNYMTPYTHWIPVMTVVFVLATLILSCHFDLKIFIKKSDPE
jgi:hypothetical protein